MKIMITVLVLLAMDHGNNRMIVAFSLKGVMFWQMTTAIAIEDVRREVKILRALTGHKNLVQFYEAYEDDDNVYVVME
jgi:serine/threonine protein kinase